MRSCAYLITSSPRSKLLLQPFLELDNQHSKDNTHDAIAHRLKEEFVRTHITKFQS